MAGRSQSGADHRTLDELEIARSGIALDGEVLLEVTCLQFEVGNTGETHDGVLQFHQTVGEVHIEFTVPVLVDLAFHGETGAADADAVTDLVGIVGGSEEHGGIHLGTDIEPEFVARGGGRHNEYAVLCLYVEHIGLDGHTVLVVLDRLLGLNCRNSEQCQRDCK